MADRFVFAPSTFPEPWRGTELSWGRRSLYQFLASFNILVCMLGIESNDFDIKVVSIFIDCHIETARNTHLAHVDLRLNKMLWFSVANTFSLEVSLAG